MDTRAKILDAAITLTRRAGFSAAGINDIVSESGAPKGSVYHFFPGGKRQIVSEALAVYAQRVLEIYDRALGSAERPADKIHALFDVVARRLTQGEYRQSCAAGAVCLDLDAELEPVREAIERAFDDWLALLAKHFPIQDPERRRSFAGLVLTAIEGGYIRGRAGRSPKPFQEAAAWLAELADRESKG